MDERIGTITDKGVQWPKKSISGQAQYNRPPIGTVNIGGNHFVVLDVQPTDAIRAEIEALRTPAPRRNKTEDKPNATD